MKKRTGRGGPRGGGAPRGNKNALKHGRRSQDHAFALFWQSLTSSQQEYALPYMRSAGAAGAEAAMGEISGNIVPFASSSSPKRPQYTHTHRDTQPNNQRWLERQEAVLRELISITFLGAEPFVEKHRERLDVFEAVLADIRHIEEVDPGALSTVDSKGALVRKLVHEALVIRTGRLLQCPYCGYRQFIMVLADAQEQSS